MLRLFVVLSAVALSALLFTALGCGSSPENPDTPPATVEKAADSKSDHDHATHGDEHEKVEANLAKLAPDEQKSARAQKICPVTEEPLGSMGTPIQVDVKDQTVWVCCKGCVEEVKENPDKYLAKLEK